MKKIFLRFVGWIFLLGIVFSSILFMGMTNEIIYRVVISAIMTLMLIVFVVIPFWIAYNISDDEKRFGGK